MANLFLSHLVTWISSNQSSILKKGTMVIETKSLLPTPAVQTTVDQQDPSTPPSHHPPPHQHDQRGTHLGPHDLDHHPQSLLATFQDSPGSIINTHMEEQQGVTVCRCNKFCKSFNNVPNPSPWQGVNLPRWQVQLSEGVPVCCNREPFISNTHHFFWCSCMAHGQWAQTPCLTDLAPHLLWQHWIYSIVANLQAKQDPSFRWQKSQAQSFCHHGNLHFPSWWAQTQPASPSLEKEEVGSWSCTVSGVQSISCYQGPDSANDAEIDHREGFDQSATAPLLFNCHFHGYSASS